jgi:predicted nuclease of predicted toxin-antitoxin system
MAKITLLLDEDVRPILGEILRQRGYDAVHVSAQVPLRDLLRRVLRFLGRHTADDVKNNVLWLDE